MKLKFIVAPILAVCMFATGCSFAWVGTLEGYLKIAAPAIIQILELIALAKGSSVNPLTIAKVNGDASALQSLAASIDKASQQNVPSACAAFNVGLQTFVADLPQLETIGQVPNPTKQAQIQDAVLLAQGVLADIETPVKACQASSPAEASLSMAAAASRIKSPDNFVKQYNAVMGRASDTKKLKIHLYSKSVRILSLGFAQ